MALRFADSFAHYAAADGGEKWDTFYGTIATGRFGRSGWSRNFSVGSNPALAFDNQSTWIVGMAILALEDDSSSGRFYNWQVQSGGWAHQCGLSVTSDGKLYFERNGTQVGDYSARVLCPGRWYYIESKITFHPTSGTAVVRVDGEEWLSVTGNTALSGETYASRLLWLYTNNATRGHTVNDLYVCDGTGSVNNDFLGDVRVEALLPSGAGATTQWTPNTGSNYAAVDDNPPDDDTTYVWSETADQIDTYAMGNLETTAGTIHGVQYLLNVRGERSVALVARPASTNRVGTTQATPASYAYLREIAELNPEDSAAWEIADVNGMEFGVKLVS